MQYRLSLRRHHLASTAMMLGALLFFSQALAQGVFTVNQPWVKPGARATEAYMVLMASEGARLIGVRSSLAARASLRGANVSAAQGIELPPRRLVTLKPGGTRIVLSGLARQLNRGDRVPLILTIERPDGARQDISVDAEARTEWPVDAELRAHRH
jgi:copper(I)-binding protein